MPALCLLSDQDPEEVKQSWCLAAGIGHVLHPAGALLLIPALPLPVQPPPLLLHHAVLMGQGWLEAHGARQLSVWPLTPCGVGAGVRVQAAVAARALLWLPHKIHKPQPPAHMNPQLLPGPLLQVRSSPQRLVQQWGCCPASWL